MAGINFKNENEYSRTIKSNNNGYTKFYLVYGKTRPFFQHWLQANYILHSDNYLLNLYGVKVHISDIVRLYDEIH